MLGAVVVVDKGAVPVGIVTDRDLALRIIADGRDLTTPARSFMSDDPVTIRADAHLNDVNALMRQQHIRRVPITDPTGAVVGMVALDDVSLLLAGEFGASVAAVQEDRGP